MCRCRFWRVRPLCINGISQSICLYFEPSLSSQYFKSVSRVVYVFVQCQVGTVMSLSVLVLRSAYSLCSVVSGLWYLKLCLKLCPRTAFVFNESHYLEEMACTMLECERA